MNKKVKKVNNKSLVYPYLIKCSGEKILGNLLSILQLVSNKFLKAEWEQLK